MGMKNQCVIFSPFFALLVATILSVLAGACTISYPTVRVGSSFLVRVTDRGRPVQGLRLKLVRDDASMSEMHITGATTDDHGLAQFRDLLPGSLTLSAEHDGGIADAVNVEVAPDGQTGVTVPLRWPSEKLVSVRTVSGTLRDPLKPRRFSVSLLEGLSAHVIRTTDTDSDGQFTLPNVPSGIYFLSLKPFEAHAESSEKDGGWIGIEVNSEAEEEKLDLDLGWSSCGLSYTDRTKCSHAELNVETFCGKVVDPVGAVISNADVLLLDNSRTQRVLRETHTDIAGRFVLLDAKDGTYQLVVKSPGFDRLQEMVRIQNSQPSATCSRPVSVRLGLFGSCSSAEVIPRLVPQQTLAK
jgi:hypothetical protein